MKTRMLWIMLILSLSAGQSARGQEPQTHCRSFFRSLWSVLFRAPSAAPARRDAKPELEALEDRSLPSAWAPHPKPHVSSAHKAPLVAAESQANSIERSLGKPYARLASEPAIAGHLSDFIAFGRQYLASYRDATHADPTPDQLEAAFLDYRATRESVAAALAMIRHAAGEKSHHGAGHSGSHNEGARGGHGHAGHGHGGHGKLASSPHPHSRRGKPPVIEIALERTAVRPGDSSRTPRSPTGRAEPGSQSLVIEIPQTPAKAPKQGNRKTADEKLAEKTYEERDEIIELVVKALLFPRPPYEPRRTRLRPLSPASQFLHNLSLQ